MRKHKHLSFAVDDASGKERTFSDIDKATAFAVSLALSDGLSHNLDVLVSSRAAAKVYGGDDAVEIYDDDPEASVFERIEISARSLGRVP